MVKIAIMTPFSYEIIIKVEHKNDLIQPSDMTLDVVSDEQIPWNGKRDATLALINSMITALAGSLNVAKRIPDIDYDQLVVALIKEISSQVRYPGEEFQYGFGEILTEDDLKDINI